MDLKINKAQPNFKAKLQLKGQGLKQYLKNNNIQKTELEVLAEKFSKATKDTKGTLRLNFGEYYDGNPYTTIPPHIAYLKGKNYIDRIPVELFEEKISAEDSFVNKLVKILKIFKTRERNILVIKNLLEKADNIAEHTHTNSLTEAESIFKLRDWRKYGYYDNGLTNISTHDDIIFCNSTVQ